MNTPMRACLPLALLLVAACSKPVPETAAATPATPAPNTPAARPASAPAAIASAPPEEKCTHEPRADPDDKRPRCGGMGTPQASASHAYRITLGNGDTITACDITQPFSGKIAGGMVSMAFTPTSAHGGTVLWRFLGAGGVVDTSYNYSLSGPEESLTGTFQSTSAVCGKAAGLTACGANQRQKLTSTWTRIEACTQ